MKSLIDNARSFSATHVADPRHPEDVRDRLDQAVPPDASVCSLVEKPSDVAEAVQAHAQVQLETLHGHPCVREGVETGRLGLQARYDEVHTGSVRVHPAQAGGPAFGAL
ncbi:hypothetical protein ACFV2Q_29900 [Streptomyces sp. NPDC059650]|uniref:hypothetical protein n=1 Tax=Streptomyces sp. NPDC059650 TaxID=3346896 RepID=UPI003698EF90